MGVYPTLPAAGEGDHVPVLSPVCSPLLLPCQEWTRKGRLGGAACSLTSVESSGFEEEEKEEAEASVPYSS